MEAQEVILTVLFSGLGTPLVVFVLARMFTFGSNPTGLTDEEIITRNSAAYRIVGALFLLGLCVPISLYALLDIDDNAAWPAALGFSFSVVMPVVYLKVREIRSGVKLEEIVRYGEITDGVPRKGQLIVFIFWILVALVAVGCAVYQSMQHHRF
jgi:hypothetical protein